MVIARSVGFGVMAAWRERRSHLEFPSASACTTQGQGHVALT